MLERQVWSQSSLFMETKRSSVSRNWSNVRSRCKYFLWNANAGVRRRLKRVGTAVFFPPSLHLELRHRSEAILLALTTSSCLPENLSARIDPDYILELIWWLSLNTHPWRSFFSKTGGGGVIRNRALCKEIQRCVSVVQRVVRSEGFLSV